ncbi:MAG: hypothetical protein PW789_04820 [Edaphobacter sp.]|uniref:hypothetical protein n=1 Tax=Edaphobacter sp. TaxID=1934404 RepID=UPI00238A8576|nr:hypothetical protein [Edaphobacter sp.]MDE1175910.1 hypothetical protein [Edaphobacter sp.]
MPTPEIGQLVRLDGHEERLVVKSLSGDERMVELVTLTGHPCSLTEVPVEDLLPGEDLSAG